MKVAYILHDTDSFGGTNRSFLQMLYAIIKSGVEPLVVLPNKNGIYSELQEKGIETLILNYRPNTYPYEESIRDYLLWLPRLVARRVVNAIADRKLAQKIAGFDMVHTNVSIIDIGARAAKRQGIPHVYHFREYGDRDFRMRYYPSKQRFYQSVRHAICITHGIQAYHHPAADTCVVYNGILSSTTPRYDAQPDRENYLLYAGRLEKTKGVEELLEAYARSQRTIPLWVAGFALKEDYQFALQQLCRQLGIDDHVRFLGNRTDILPLMASARAIIIPSQHEAFGRTMAEAMYQRCLTIGRDTDGLHEQFENGLKQTGDEIGLRFRNIDELTAHIRAVSEADAGQWQAYKERAFRTVSQLYTVEACAAAIMDYYQRIAQEK